MFSLSTSFFDIASPRASLEGNTLTLEVPGYSEQDIKVQAEPGLLTISGKREPNRAFLREYALSDKVDLDGLTATVKNGLLTIRLPTAKESQPRQITVTAG